MAVGAHIVLADIKHRHIKLFDSTELQSYLNDANQRFEDYAQKLGIAPASIPATLQGSVKSFILNDMYRAIASDNIGSEGTFVGDSNLYQTIYAISTAEYNKLKAGVTKNAILGETVDDSSSAVNWGTIVRG